MSANAAMIERLRSDIAQIAGEQPRLRDTLPFGIAEIDSKLPGGGLVRGALHEIAGGGNAAVHGAAAQFFAASIAARTSGEVLWCYTQRGLFSPALHQVGLTPDRLTYFEARDEKSVLACFEEALRHGGLSCVIAELARLPMTASRRLQLAAEQSGTMGIAVRRWKRPNEATDFGQPTAATTRWKITKQQSEKLPVPGIGRERWQLELIRVRAGESANFIVEASDEQGFIALSSDMADRSAVPGAWHKRAFA